VSADTDAGYSITPVRRATAERELPAEDDPGREGRTYRLDIADVALAGMRKQAFAAPQEEVGGVLLGRVYQSEDRYRVEVTDHVAVPSESKSAMHFDFDLTSIQAIFARLDSRSSDRVVGWYHSHVSGTPFMSRLDVRVHRSHFAKPWYVSCVLSRGEWGVPAGFWRLVDDELKAVDDYSVTFRTLGSAAERHDRFLRACQLADPDDLDDPDPAVRTGEVARALGVDPKGAVIKALEAVRAPSLDPLGQMQVFVDAANLVADEPAAVPEIARLRDRLQQARSRSETFVPLMASANLRGDIAVNAHECYTKPPGSKIINRFRIDHRLTWPLELNVEITRFAFGADDAIWAVVTNDRLVRIMHKDTPKTAQAKTFEFDATLCALPALDEELLRIAPTADVMWASGTANWYRFALERDGDNSFRISGTELGKLPMRRAMLVRRLAGAVDDQPVLLLGRDGSNLRQWLPRGAEWAESARHRLPPPMDRMRIKQAVTTLDDLYVLFDGKDGPMLAVFDASTLEFRHQFVANSVLDSTRIWDIASDNLGRVYACAGMMLFRI
jgi:proteasome lid subunit RPN8/RPN11